MSDRISRPATDLPAPTDMAQALRARLPDVAAIDWVAETGSTNTDLLVELRTRSGPARVRVLGTHRQHSGRGRAGRTMHNQAGDTLMFSCTLPVRMTPAQLPCVSLIAGLTACETLRRHARPDRSDTLRVKWPNDIQIDEAKLAGLLVESVRDRAAGPNAHAVVIGMGMNLHNSAALAERLQRPVADWSQCAGDAPLDALVADVILAWRDALHTCARDSFAAFQQRFRAVDALAGRAVNVIDDGRILHSGTALGVNADGHLLVTDSTGPNASPIAILFGDVSIRTQQP